MGIILSMEIKLQDYDETTGKEHDIQHGDDIGFFSEIRNDNTFYAY